MDLIDRKYRILQAIIDDYIESKEPVGSRTIAKKYDIETEVIYNDSACPVVDYKSNSFALVEKVAADVYPGVQICPYVMTGGTDAKYYQAVSDNCLRFAPLYIDQQQYGSIHGLNENIYSGTLPMGVDFYKNMILRSKEGI